MTTDMTSKIIISTIIAAGLVMFLVRTIKTSRIGKVGVVKKNRHMGIYVVDVDGSLVNAQSVCWDIPVGTKVTLNVYYGKVYITGTFNDNVEDADIVSEV